MTNPNAPANVVDGIHGADAMRSDNIGLTKREHFAAMAMASYAGADYVANSGIPQSEIAEWAVEMADALINALNKKQ